MPIARRAATVGAVACATMRLRLLRILRLLFLPGLVPAVAPWVATLHWTLDLAASFAVQAVALCLAGLLLSLTRSAWRLLFALGLLSSVLAVTLLGPAAAERAAPDTKGMRVGAFNLLYGNEANANRFLAALGETPPDVLVLSEVTPEWLRVVQAALPAHQLACGTTSDGPFGIALLTTLPYQAAAVFPGGYPWAPGVQARVQGPFGWVTVFGLHPPRPGDGRHNFERDHALRALGKRVNQGSEPVLVLGDLNATATNPALGEFARHAELRSAAGWRWLPSWPTYWPWPLRIAIDHVLVSRDLAVAELRQSAEFGSDHLGLLATIARPVGWH